MRKERRLESGEGDQRMLEKSVTSSVSVEKIGGEGLLSLLTAAGCKVTPSTKNAQLIP